ncbi:MAG: hypothetical protein KBD05_03575 [Candidatus Pacebacteria bacterium]|nr:hypothetical protein [Candidatus Paceibacterota bacterium]
MSSNAVFFLGVLIFIFVLWAITGGPSKPFSFAGPYLKPISGPGQVAEPYDLKAGTSSTSGGSFGSFFDLEAQIDDLSSFGEASEYRGLVSISRNPSGPRNTSAKQEYLSLSVSRRASDPITFSGWKLESASTDTTVTIPQGVEVPHSGKVNTLSTIELSPGDTVIVTSGRSPIGVSFRENICTGYLSEFQEFSPGLEQDCPSAQSEIRDAGGDDECIQFGYTVPRCSVVSRAPSSLSNSCENILGDLNYNSCAARHMDEPSFMGDTWRVFLGKSGELWRENHETIRLLDAEGKTVDVLAY